MAIRNIVKEGDPILREKSIQVRRFDQNLAKLLDDMADTMYEANGCGLAAPQVGISKRIIVVDVDDDNGLIEMVNPALVQTSGSKIEAEGCLSVPDLNGYVERYYDVVVAYQDRFGQEFSLQAEGYLARALQHEIDHLEGILFIDLITDPPADQADDEAEQAQADANATPPKPAQAKTKIKAKVKGSKE